MSRAFVTGADRTLTAMMAALVERAIDGGMEASDRVFAGKVAIVAGGSLGIGRAAVEQLQSMPLETATRQVDVVRPGVTLWS